MSKYGGAYRRWKDFAQAKGFCLIPAELVQFAEYLGDIAMKTKTAVEEAVNAIIWFHSVASLRPLTEDCALKAVVEGLRRRLARPVTKKEPVTVDDLKKIVESSNLASLSDIRTVTICLLSFAAFLRYDEMAELRCSDVELNHDHVKLKIQRSKTDQLRQGDEVVVVRTNTVTCPV